MSKLAGTLLGLLLAAYGINQEWLNRGGYDNAAKQRYCDAGLCPQEFWEAHTFLLQQRGAGGASAKTLPELRRALLADNASAYSWANLAEAERDSGNLELANYAYRRALALGPGNPAIIFRAANFSFENGDSATTMDRLSAILRNPELTAYYQPVYLTYARLGVPMEEILEKGVPATAIAAEPFLRFWLDDNKVAETEATWRWMVARNLISEQTCATFTSFLIRNGMPEQALAEWQRVYKNAGTNYRVSNWLNNGGFENEPKPGPLDWHIGSTADVEAARVEDVTRDGQWSLRLSFNGKQNVSYRETFQEALLSPGRWQLNAFVKFENVSRDHGLSLRVYDVASPKRLDVSTTAKPGSADWTSLNQGFDVGLETKLVRVEVVLTAVPGTEDAIGGRAWLDSITLAPER